MTDMPLDCTYELESDPLILFAKRLAAEVERQERAGYRVLPSKHDFLTRAEHVADGRRAEILAKYGVKE